MRSPLPTGALLYKFDGVAEQQPLGHPPRNTAILLALPETALGMRYTKVLVSCHHPSSQGNNDIFHRPADRAMVRIWADIQLSSQHWVNSALSFGIFVSTDAILAVAKEAVADHGTTTSGVTVLPWSKWGHHTRIMDVGVVRHEISDPGPSTSAFYHDRSGTLFYRDFNTADAIKADQNSPHFAPKSSLVVEPSKMERPDCLSQGLISTSLPYREHTLHFDSAERVMLGEDFLVTYRHNVVPGFTRYGCL